MLSARRGWFFMSLLVACSSPDPNASSAAATGTTQASAGSSGGGAAGNSSSAGSAATTVGSATGAAGSRVSAGTAGVGVKNTSPSGATGDVTSSGVAGQAGASQNTGAAGVGGMSSMTGAAGAAGSGTSTAADGCMVAPITMDMRSRYDNLDEKYYTKFASANGIIVATGDKVDDEAITRYCKLLGEMMSNDKVRQAVLDDKMWFTMIGEEEQLSSLPQINRDYGTSLNQRARGLGGLTPTICAEDSIMCLPGDRWNGDCICPHETGHTLYSSGIQRVPELSDRLTKITDATRSSGRLSNAYVWMDGDESGMMAWGVQAWYNCAIDGTMGAYHSDINTRAELKTELPEFYQFLSELLPQDNKYEDCYAKP